MEVSHPRGLLWRWGRTAPRTSGTATGVIPPSIGDDMRTTTITAITPADRSAGVPAVRWEPCRAFPGDTADDGMCDACGWPSDDHELAAAA